MTPQPLKFKKAAWSRIGSHFPVYAIEDYQEINHLIKPQEQRKGKAFRPDCGFVFAQSETYIFAINVAMDTKGYYYFGYDLNENEGGSGCYPSAHWKDHKKSLTLKGCVLNALNHIKGMCKYYDQPPYPLYVKTATAAISKLQSAGVKQLSLFDFSD